MKRIFFFLFLSLFLFSISGETKEIKMLFWYPGEAGTPQEAKPVLDLFFHYLSKKLTSDQVTGVYINTVNDGIVSIKRELPDIAIVSYPTWVTYKNRMAGAEPWLSALPFPHGKSTEVYTLVGNQSTLVAGATVYSDETLTSEFIQHYLFPSLKNKIKIQKTPDTFNSLKRIGQKEIKAYILLNPLEVRTLEHLKTPWSQNLHKIQTSQPIPTARVILFSPDLPQKNRLQKILVEMQRDPAAKEILEEMRLVGFSFP